MKFVRILSLILILVILLSFAFTYLSMASNLTGELPSFKTSGVTDSNVNGKIKSLGSTIIYTIQLVGMFMGIILLVWFGIKWMTSKPGDKSMLKEQAWNYVIGAGLLFGAGTIAQWIYDLVTKIGVTGTGS